MIKRCFKKLGWRWFFFLVVLIGLAYWGAWTSWQRSLIPIRQIKIEGPFRAVTQAQVQQVFAPFQDEDFLRFPAHRLQKTLLTALPWLASVRVVRTWPPGLRLVLTERHAVAQWNQEALFSSDGMLFKPAKPWPNGLLQCEGPRDRSRTMWQHLQAMQQWCPAVASSLERVRLNDRGAWLIEQRSGVVARLGRIHFKQRFHIFCEIKDHSGIASRSRGPLVYDLRYPNGFTVGPQKAS